MFDYAEEKFWPIMSKKGEKRLINSYFTLIVDTVLIIEIMPKLFQPCNVSLSCSLWFIGKNDAIASDGWGLKIIMS